MTEQSRLDVLEGRVEEQSRNWDRVHAQLERVDQKVDDVGRDLSARAVILDDKLSAKIAALDDRLSAKIGALDDRLSARIDALDHKLDRKIDDLRGEISKQFRWTMGTMITLLATMLTIGAGVITALLTRPAL